MKRIVCLLIVFTLAASAPAADQAVLKRARDQLYTSRQASLAILEQAVQESPDDVVYWMELIRALDVDSQNAFADRASRQAIKLHPNNRDLIINRAWLLQGGEAVDILADLAAIPGQQARAQRLIELAECNLRVPETEPWPSSVYGTMFTRLWAQGKIDRAKAWLADGLAQPKDKTYLGLLAQRAIVEALDGQFDAALADHIAADDVQAIMVDDYHGVADAFLDKGQPKLTIKSYARVEPRPDASNAGYEQRVLALARAQTGDLAGALDLLQTENPATRLLRFQVLLDARKDADAKEIADALVASAIQYSGPGSHFGPWSRQLLWEPVSLRPVYRKAIKALLERYPKQRQELVEYLGTGDEQRPPGEYNGWSPVRSLKAQIAETEKAVGAAPPKKAAELREQLAWTYLNAGRFDEALPGLAALAPVHDDISVSSAHLEWSLARRRAEAIKASDEDYGKLSAARAIIANIKAARWNHPKIDGQPWLTEDQVADRLIAIGPAVLSDVLTQLGPNVISGEDRRVWVRVIAAHGSAQDAPVLISTLRLVSHKSSGQNDSFRAQQDENDRLTAIAIDDCLQKLTGVNPAGEDRAKAWTAWWAANAGRITSSR